MDLIYTDEFRNEVGVILNPSLDLAYGNDENDFELLMSIYDVILTPDSLIYIDGTEYGGVIDSIETDTKESTVAYRGTTFHGLLGSYVIRPLKKADYRIVSGTFNEIVAMFIDSFGIGDLFQASNSVDSPMFYDYQFDRYCDFYSGLRKMLKSVDRKLILKLKNGKVIIDSEPIIDFSNVESFDVEEVNHTLEVRYNRINHLICLGKGELSEREVLDLYVDDKGQIVKKRFYKGLKERIEIYDYPNAESLEELEKGGIDRLKELNQESAMSTSFDESFTDCAIDDLIPIEDKILNVKKSAPVTKKIVHINGGIITIEYEVG